MSNTPPITQEHFTKRMVDLCLRSGLSGFPKNEVDQHILLKSAVLSLAGAETFTEKEVNEKLKHWVNQVVPVPGMDHVIVRRRLVDTGYLNRSKDGATYTLAPAGTQAYQFEDSIDQIDVVRLISDAREEMARRKREHMQKASGS